MTMKMVIEVSDQQGVQAVLQAVETYKERLRVSITRTNRRLGEFESRYGVSTDEFLERMTAEDLHGGDLEYVEWAGEAKIRAGLETELRELEHARYQLP